MSGLVFLSGALWPLVIGLAVLMAVALRWEARRRARRLRALCGPRTSIVADHSVRDERLRRRLWWGGWLAALVALLRPGWGETAQPVEQPGVDIVVCLDVSRSMLARDVPPTRLDRARRAVRELSERLRGDRLGLVSFAGEARLTMPLTRDGRTFRELLDLASPATIRRGGTDLGAALDTAAAALESAESEHRVIILITDGEDHGGAGLQAARRCAERGVRVHCLGYGSARGSKVVVVDRDGGDGFVRDRDGRDVVSALDEAGLRAIAAAGLDGAFVDGARVPEPLATLYTTRIEPVGYELVAASTERRVEERFQWPLLLGVLAWVISLGRFARRSA